MMGKMLAEPRGSRAFCVRHLNCRQAQEDKAEAAALVDGGQAECKALEARVPGKLADGLPNAWREGSWFEGIQCAGVGRFEGIQ